MTPSRPSIPPPSDRPGRSRLPALGLIILALVGAGALEVAGDSRVWPRSATVFLAGVATLLAASVPILYFDGLGAALGAPPPRDRCPRCRRGTIERVAASPDGVRYYRCDECGSRSKRLARAGPREDASAPEDDHAYAPAARRVSRGTAERGAWWPERIGILLDHKRSGDLLGRNYASLGGRRGIGDPNALKPTSSAPFEDGASLWDSEIDGHGGRGRRPGSHSG